MLKIVPCDICGVVPELQRSYSARLIAHKCKDYNSGLGTKSKVISDWNNSNHKIKEENTNNLLKTKISEFRESLEWYLDNGDKGYANGFINKFDEIQKLLAV